MIFIDFLLPLPKKIWELSAERAGRTLRLYEIWLPDEERIIRARDVKFDESDSPTPLPSADNLYIAGLVDPSFEEEGRRIIGVPTAEIMSTRPPPVPQQRGGTSPSIEDSTDKHVTSETSKPLPSPPLPPTQSFFPSPSPTPSQDSAVNQCRILRNDSVIPGSFLDDEAFGDDFDSPEDETPSAQLIREASQSRRSQRSVPTSPQGLS
ncbi:hypothetical protein E4U56_006146 [Claviceps arundinis]|uniref:Uncharacterized protein n=1 Tax=Claviceps arundinis TaxID=1623583 RepID=A0A9P7MWC7_9HYPO|nr:hypothetical protein E4U56_006146 [Claviceps arundinis]